MLLSPDSFCRLYCFSNTDYISSFGWNKIPFISAHAVCVYTLRDKTFIHGLYLYHIIIVGLVDKMNFHCGLDSNRNILDIYPYLSTNILIIFAACENSCIICRSGGALSYLTNKPWWWQTYLGLGLNFYFFFPYKTCPIKGRKKVWMTRAFSSQGDV